MKHKKSTPIEKKYRMTIDRGPLHFKICVIEGKKVVSSTVVTSRVEAIRCFEKNLQRLEIA